MRRKSLSLVSSGKDQLSKGNTRRRTCRWSIRLVQNLEISMYLPRYFGSEELPRDSNPTSCAKGWRGPISVASELAGEAPLTTVPWWRFPDADWRMRVAASVFSGVGMTYSPLPLLMMFGWRFSNNSSSDRTRCSSCATYLKHTVQSERIVRRGWLLHAYCLASDLTHSTPALTQLAHAGVVPSHLIFWERHRVHAEPRFLVVTTGGTGVTPRAGGMTGLAPVASTAGV